MIINCPLVHLHSATCWKMLKFATLSKQLLELDRETWACVALFWSRDHGVSDRWSVMRPRHEIYYHAVSLQSCKDKRPAVWSVTEVKYRSAVVTEDMEDILRGTGHVAKGHQCEAVKQEVDGHGPRRGDGAGIFGSGAATGRLPTPRRPATASKTHNAPFDNHTRVPCAAWVCVCVSVFSKSLWNPK